MKFQPKIKKESRKSIGQKPYVTNIGCLITKQTEGNREEIVKIVYVKEFYIPSAKKFF